ncbi:hypothetical protein J6590_096639 [Homalodisca vitripennis]|nr:hypothetical protein J6590_096639 [Homalodisca vitripennis]
MAHYYHGCPEHSVTDTQGHKPRACEVKSTIIKHHTSTGEIGILRRKLKSALPAASQRVLRSNETGKRWSGRGIGKVA